MTENIDYKVSVDTSGAVKNVNNLTAANADLNEQLKIAKKNLSESIGETGVTSKKTQEAAFEVNNLTAQIKANNLAIKEQTATTKEAGTTQGFFEKTMRSVTGNSTAYERAMKSMGVSVGVSDGLTKAIMFSTIAYDQAVTAITGKKIAETVAEEANAVAKTQNTAATVTGTVATTTATVGITAAEIATWAWNAALAVLLAPLTAFVAIIAAVATGVYFLVDALVDEEAATARLNKTNLETIAIRDRDIKQRKDLQKVIDHNNEQSIKLAEAKGLEGEALEKLRLKYKSNEIAMASLNAETQKGVFLSARKAILDAKESGGSEEEIKRLKAIYDSEYKEFVEFRDLIVVKSQEYRDIKSNADIEQAKKDTKAREKQEKVKPEKEDPAIEKMSKGLEKLKEINSSFDAEVELADKSDNEKEKARIEAHYQELADLRLQDHQLTYDEDLHWWAKQAEAAELAAEKKKKIAEAEFNHKRDLSFSLVNLGQSIIGLFEVQDAKTNAQKKKNIHINHAIALGDIGLNTARAVMAETAKGIPISIPLIAADIAMGVVQTGAAIASTNKALKAVGGGSADSGSSAGSASALNIAPQIGFQNSSENQIATSISKSNAEQKVNVTVLASDITDVQNNLATNVVQNSF